MRSRLWPKTKRGWAYLAAFALVFGALNWAALAGSRVALGLLVMLSAGLIGALGAGLISRPLLRGSEPGSPRRLLGFLLGVASVFGVPFLGAALFGIPAFPTAEGGNVGHAVHGFSYGFGLALARFSIGSGGSAVVRYRTAGRSGSVWLRAAVIVGGALAGLYTLAFVLSLLGSFVVGPIVRGFA